MAVKADVFAGSIAAELTTKALLHPLDTIKTRLQYTVVPKRQRAGASSIPIVSDLRLGFRVLADATRSPEHSMKDPSLRPRSRAADAANAARSLYRGLTPQLVGVVPIALVYMPSYEVASGALKGTPLQSTPIAGVLTGVASAVVRVPVSVIKEGQSPAAGGLYAGLRATVVLDTSYAALDTPASSDSPFGQAGPASRAEGMASLWRGLLPRLVTKSTGSLVWYTTYMEARRAFNAARRTSADG
ncbi:hypothetical protein EMIHUDRAFT_457130 [Emiliania huxleyi CCMP1516]|uniref:Mitochondrial carrier protein n=2 Tax=Emiliania huxleyi TaxID=2903 RepID=A0A0D3JVQ4_EMIH1|nr:hypothetical protein EMIHUDRAFT_457130 [Emiliania huxleyi CCMP1516]EOD27589.1 hypothetical protein EMIHUDRAFT_457130 [Emiliania huxleyi CCMP1516]|eukprot:XP_005780018.1 hypothetical protein EMIHUDRAFT_457130 [Emiliania huxleyi CCMP1516]